MPASDTWKRRIDRATDLVDRDEAVRPLLLTYRRLLGLQRDGYEALSTSDPRPTGSLERDLPMVRACAAPMLSDVATTGPAAVGEQAARMLGGPDAAIDAMLVAAWRTASGHEFIPKLILQPYAQWLAAMDVRPVDRGLPDGPRVCPFCGGAPQVSILDTSGGSDGGGRQLLCATCSTIWPFRRVLCAHCGEEDEHRLSYFHAPAFDHLRVDTCDTCRHYLKTVDLTRLGTAVPVVDEVAGAALDLWASERGYRKIELNLVGL